MVASVEMTKYGVEERDHVSHDGTLAACGSRWCGSNTGVLRLRALRLAQDDGFEQYGHARDIAARMLLEHVEGVVGLGGFDEEA